MGDCSAVNRARATAKRRSKRSKAGLAGHDLARHGTATMSGHGASTSAVAAAAADRSLEATLPGHSDTGDSAHASSARDHGQNSSGAAGLEDEKDAAVIRMNAERTAADRPQEAVSGSGGSDGADESTSGSEVGPALPSKKVHDPVEASERRATESTLTPAIMPPSIHKRKLKRPPKGILKPAPVPSKTFSFRRDILQQLNSRLAQQGVNVQVPVPQGGGTLGTFGGSAQGTAQAAGSILGGMFKRVSGLATGTPLNEDGQNSSGVPTQRKIQTPSTARNTTVQARDSPRPPQSSATPLSPSSSETTLVNPTAFHSTANNNLPQPSASVRPLRRVRFSAANMGITYPISGSIAPGAEDLTRLRIEKEHRRRLKERLEKRWSPMELEALYRECCRMREEHPLKKMRSIFEQATQNTPPALKTIDLSFVPLDRQAIEPISDLLSIDFGLQKLVLENCGLTDDGLKSILHALLVSGSLPNLSLASNKRIKYHGWRYVGIFMRRAKALKYLDLSENSINRASLEHIIGAVGQVTAMSSEAERATESADWVTETEEGSEDESLTVPAKLLLETTSEISALTSLRLENCGLKTASLEMLAQNVRFSKLCHLSLRRNRISNVGAVALAIMLKDYPDEQLALAEQASLGAEAAQNPLAPYAVRTSPRIEATELLQYHQGSPEPRRSVASTSFAAQYPTVVSSPGGGVTRRTLPPSALDSLQDATRDSTLLQSAQVSHNGRTASPRIELHHDLTDEEREQVRRMKKEHRQTEGQAIAILQAKRAQRMLSSMSRVGSLLTLDLKSNEIRGGVVYLSQALKRNRTLKVLNLSDNGIEITGLVSIADALKCNSTLETLDMSHNPCSGPGLEGITTLRTAFTLDSNLKRLFLSDTDLSSEGAIALAEFLPEAKSLIHLDLTENHQIDIAGVMALAVSVKMNRSLRCLDLNIPPNAPDFARLSQDILSSCVRNTEYAQRRAQQKGVKAPIAAPIYKSSLARAAKEKEERARIQEATREVDRTMGDANTAPGNGNLRNSAPRTAEEMQAAASRTIDAAQECVLVLHELIDREREQEKERLREREASRRPDGTTQRQVSDFARDLLAQSRHLRGRLRTALGSMPEGAELGRALQVNDELERITSQLKSFFAGQTDAGDVNGAALATPTKASGHLRPTANDTPSTPVRLEVPSSPYDTGISSPNFSIGSDDDDDDDDAAADRATVSSISSSAISTALSGLGIEESGEADGQPKAAREVPGEDQCKAQADDDETALVNHKAKGQLSEEGEIFRRAKSLSIAEDDDEEGKQAEDESPMAARDNDSEGDLSPPSETGKGKGQPLSINTHLAPIEQGTDSTSQRSLSPSHTAPSLIDDRKDVSGEELRRELLGTNVPRRPAGSPASPSTSLQVDNGRPLLTDEPEAELSAA